MTAAQDPERVRTGVVWLVAAGVIAVGAVLVAIAWWLVVPPAGARAARPSALERGLFDQATGARDTRAAGERRLEQYEWVDRGARIVHLPIERAIDAVVADPALIDSAPVAASDVGNAASSAGIGAAAGSAETDNAAGSTGLGTGAR